MQKEYILKNKILTDKGNVSVRCRNEVANNLKEKICPTLEQHMTAVTNQDWIKEYKDAEGNTIYAHIKLTITNNPNNLPKKKEEEVFTVIE